MSETKKGRRMLGELQRYACFHRSCIVALLMLSSLSACGGSFPGQLPTTPSWVETGRDRKQLRGAVGWSTNQRLIRERRGLAEEAARQRFLEELSRDFEDRLEVGPSPAQGAPPLPESERQALRAALKRLPWNQLMTIEAHFFDPEANRQYCLVTVSWSALDAAIQDAQLPGSLRAELRDHLGPIFPEGSSAR